MVCFQQSLFGRTSWERFFQMTGWTLEPCSQRSQPPTFQCLLLEDGQEPEWCEGIRPISHGGSWMPSIGQAPDWHDGSASLLWQTLEDNVPTKYFLSPAQCSQFLRLAEIAGCPPPAAAGQSFSGSRWTGWQALPRRRRRWSGCPTRGVPGRCPDSCPPAPGTAAGRIPDTPPQTPPRTPAAARRSKGPP